MVDVVAVPDRLKHRVGKAQGQQVLDCLLAQIVVDAEHRSRGKNLADLIWILGTWVRISAAAKKCTPYAKKQVKNIKNYNLKGDTK